MLAIAAPVGKYSCIKSTDVVTDEQHHKPKKETPLAVYPRGNVMCRGDVRLTQVKLFIVSG